MDAPAIATVTAGAVVFLGAVIAVIRSVFRQVSATERNTIAVEALTEKLEGLDGKVNGHEIRLAVLEEYRRRSRS